MKINSAEFLSSYTDVKDCPLPNQPEYAFIGRSNVGKSSLINALVGRKSLAKTSSTPGKTQLINYFAVGDEWYLVDLPGYGYARVSKEQRKTFDRMIKNYLTKRENLVNVFILIDSRHAPQKNDLEFMEFLGENEIPFSMVFTKIDKLSSSELNKNQLKYKKKMLHKWEALPPIFLTSASAKIGQEKIANYIAKLNESLKDKF